MILLANALVMRFKWVPNWAYAGLASCLIFSYWLRPDVLSGFGFFFKTVIGGTVAGLPLFFAGILFASAFQSVKDIPAAFGANLLGALVGGILENTSMIYGVAFLNLIALGTYMLAMLVSYRPSWFVIRRPIRT
jgi:hypothetical protein